MVHWLFILWLFIWHLLFIILVLGSSVRSAIASRGVPLTPNLHNSPIFFYPLTMRHICSALKLQQQQSSYYMDSIPKYFTLLFSTLLSSIPHPLLSQPKSVSLATNDPFYLATLWVQLAPIMFVLLRMVAYWVIVQEIRVFGRKVMRWGFCWPGRLNSLNQGSVR